MSIVPLDEGTEETGRPKRRERPIRTLLAMDIVLPEEGATVPLRGEQISTQDLRDRLIPAELVMPRRMGAVEGPSTAVAVLTEAHR